MQISNFTHCSLTTNSQFFSSNAIRLHCLSPLLLWLTWLPTRIWRSEELLRFGEYSCTLNYCAWCRFCSWSRNLVAFVEAETRRRLEAGSRRLAKEKSKPMWRRRIDDRQLINRRDAPARRSTLAKSQPKSWFSWKKHCSRKPSKKQNSRFSTFSIFLKIKLIIIVMMFNTLRL